MTSAQPLATTTALDHCDVTRAVVDPCEGAANSDVGIDLHAQFRNTLERAELEQHVKDCGWHMECSYARFQAHGNPADRDAAVMWMHMQNEAIRDRDIAIGGVRHADFEDRIRNGVDFFQSPYALAMAKGLA